METTLSLIGKEIKRLLKDIDNKEWYYASLNFDFPPYINKGWTGSQHFENKEGKKLPLMIFGDVNFTNTLFLFIIEMNKGDSAVNRISFSMYNDVPDDMQISATYDQEIVDSFERNLSNSKKSKYIPWWKNHEETKDLLSNIEGVQASGNHNDSITNSLNDLLVLPKSGVQMDITNLTLDKAFFELNKAVVYKQEDPLWDGGFYLIKHDKENWTGEAILYLFDSQESKDKQWQADQVDCTLTITEEIKQLFLYIQEQYRKINPVVLFDTLDVEVSRDGVNYMTNFELDEEDVFPNKLPKA